MSCSSIDAGGAGLRGRVPQGRGGAGRLGGPALALAPKQNQTSFVVFSGDLDKVLAAFIIANGALAMGRR